jgi:hypothetical protein
LFCFLLFYFIYYWVPEVVLVVFLFFVLCGVLSGGVWAREVRELLAMINFSPSERNRAMERGESPVGKINISENWALQAILSD